MAYVTARECSSDCQREGPVLFPGHMSVHCQACCQSLPGSDLGSTFPLSASTRAAADAAPKTPHIFIMAARGCHVSTKRCPLAANVCPTAARPQTGCMAAKLEALYSQRASKCVSLLSAVCCSSAGQLTQGHCLSGQSGCALQPHRHSHDNPGLSSPASLQATPKLFSETLGILHVRAVPPAVARMSHSSPLYPGQAADLKQPRDVWCTKNPLSLTSSQPAARALLPPIPHHFANMRLPLCGFDFG